MIKRVFIPHMVGPNIIVSERVTDARGIVTYHAAAQFGPDGVAVAHRFAHDLRADDLHKCRELVAQMQSYRQAMRSVDVCDFLGLRDQAGYAPSAAGLQLLRLWADYATGLHVFCGIADAYLAQPAQVRVSPELSLDLYRQALGFHDLGRARRFLDEDGPVLRHKTLSAHHRECIYDTFFHLARRMSQRREAYGYLQHAWQARPNRERAEILLGDASFFKLSDDVVRYASFLARQQLLSPQQLAQLAVAHARKGEMAKAEAVLGDLQANASDNARKLAPKIAAFLKGQRNG